MKKFITILVLALASLVFGAKANAQSNLKVSASIIDEYEEAVGFATVSLTAENSSKVYKYELSTDEGKVTFTGVKAGKYTFKIDLMGYETFTKEIEVKGNTDLGKLVLKEDKEVLEAAKVTDVANPIIVKKDTVEYNASSFMTTDNDMLENLLKKLPGIEIDENGGITANGENVTRIYVDGKEFFTNDPQIASKNLPAKLIEKVKVVKKKSEQSEFTGIDDGQEETVIDLSVHPSMMDGIIANVMAAGGHDIPAEDATSEFDAVNDWRYQSNAMVGKFKKNGSLTLIANANNGNRMGFGGGRSGFMGGFGGGGGAMGGGGGLTSSWMAGLNGAMDFLDGNLELSGDYTYNGSNSVSGSVQDRTTYMTDGSNLIAHSDNSGLRTSDGHAFSIRYEHKFSDNTSILFEPSIDFSKGTSNSFSNTNTISSLTGKTNDGWSSQNGDNSDLSTSGRFLLRQRLGIPGRTMTVNLRYSYSNSSSETFTQSLTNSYNTGSAFANRVNQRNENTSNSTSASGRIEYNEPLGGNFYVSGNYEYSWSESKSNKETYNSGVYDVEGFDKGVDLAKYYNRNGETHDDVYSNNIYNRNINQTAGFNFMYQSSDWHGQVGASIMPRNILNETNGNRYEEKYISWAPNASIRGDITDNSNIRLNYSGRSSQPSTSQLNPVMDNSNPLRMSLGNPYLVSYFNHNGRLEYGYTNRESFFSTRVNLNGSVTQNPIVNAIWYDAQSVQYSFPINGKNTISGGGSLMVNTPFGDSNFRISSNSRVNYSQSHSYVGETGIDMSPYFNADKEFNYELFHEDFFGNNKTKDFEDYFTDNMTQNLSVSENLRLTYRTDYFEASASGNVSVSMPKYTIATASDNTTWNNSVSASINWTIGDSGFGFNTDGNYRWYRGYTTPREPSFIVNAEITKLLFNNQATLALRGYDLLGQTKSFSVSDTANYHNESSTLTLGRYVLVSLTWRFGSFGGRRGGSGRGGAGRGMGGFRGGMGGGMPMGGFGGGMGRF